MQVDKLIGGIERFFFDIVGSLIPGAILLFGLQLLVNPEPIVGVDIPKPNTTPEWWLFVAIAFALGNGMTTLGEWVVEPAFLVITSPLWSVWRKRKKTTDVIPRATLFKEIAERTPFKRFAQRVLPAVDAPGPKEVHELRNIAMSLISADERATVIRFMFLSLLSLGTATAIWSLGTALLIRDGLVQWSWRRAVVIIIVTFASSFFFLLRRFEFFNRAMRLPFDMAIAPSVSVGPARGGRSVEGTSGSAGPKTVYLAGGHQTAWRQRVMAEVRGFEYRDPSTHGLEDARAYTAWDLEAVRSSDVLFAYFEATNPSGYGLSLEVGYAAALGKHVIFVDERSAADPDVARYLGIIRESANVYFKTLEEGIDYLRRVGWLTQQSRPS